jgi:hypothetical protein
MQAIFRFNGSEEVQVSNLGPEIQLSRDWQGIGPSQYAPLETGSAEEIRAKQDHAQRIPVTARFSLQMTKSQARSIASALMQAAAEA